MFVPHYTHHYVDNKEQYEASKARQVVRNEERAKDKEISDRVDKRNHDNYIADRNARWEREDRARYNEEGAKINERRNNRLREEREKREAPAKAARAAEEKAKEDEIKKQKAESDAYWDGVQAKIDARKAAELKEKTDAAQRALENKRYEEHRKKEDKKEVPVDYDAEQLAREAEFHGWKLFRETQKLSTSEFALDDYRQFVGGGSAEAKAWAAVLKAKLPAIMCHANLASNVRKIMFDGPAVDGVADTKAWDVKTAGQDVSLVHDPAKGKKQSGGTRKLADYIEAQLQERIVQYHAKAEANAQKSGTINIKCAAA